MSLQDAKRAASRIADRLRELGADIPPMPPREDFEVSVCAACGGRGTNPRILAVNGDKEPHPIRCFECQGTGQTVYSDLVEWNRHVVSEMTRVLTPKK